MASFVDAIRKILEKYNTLGQYTCAICSCKVFDRKERKKLMIKHRKKYYKAMEPEEKKDIIGEKQFRDMKNKQEIQKKTVPKTRNNGYWVISILRMP